MSEPFIGEIKLWSGAFEPRGWAFCDGRMVDIREYQALYSIIGTSYGGDGRQTFGLPDLRGRVPVGHGRAPGLSQRILGTLAGKETAEVPRHSHGAGALSMNEMKVKIKCNSVSANINDPQGNFMGQAGVAHKTYNTAASADAYMNDGSVELSGLDINGETETYGVDDIDNNMPPYQVLNYIIALDGLYPSRN